MKNQRLIAAAILCASLASISCRPSRDAARANEAVARHGGDAGAIGTLPPDRGATTPRHPAASSKKVPQATAR